MAYNTIFYGSFHDNVNEDRIDIYIKQLDFAGEPSALVLDANPLVITYSPKDFDAQIFGCGAEINIVNPTNDFFKFDSIFSVPERQNYVEIIKTPTSGDPSIYLFQGYVLPDMYSTTLQKNIRLTIPATDQLSTLDKLVPPILVNDASYRADEYIGATDLIGSILLDASIADKIWINNTLENTNYVKDSSSTVFDNVFFLADVFQDKTDILDSKSILEKVLKPFYSRVYYFNGSWRIERIADIGNQNKDYIIYSTDACSYTYSDSNNRIDLTCPDNLLIAGTPSLTYVPGYIQQNCKLNYKQPDSLTENIFTDVQPLDPCTASDASTYMPLGWPAPIYREWMVSQTPHINEPANTFWFATGTADCSLRVFQDNLPKKEGAFEGEGVWFTMKSPKLIGWTSAAEVNYWSSQTLTTSINFTPITPSAYSGKNIDVNYKVCIPGAAVYTTPTTAAWETRFALRAIDKNNKNWWLAKHSDNDTSTYWSANPYYYDTSILKSQLETDNEGARYLKWEISETVQMTSPIMTDVSVSRARKRRTVTLNQRVLWNTLFNKWYYYDIYTPTDPEYIGKLYLDFYIPRIAADYSPGGGPEDNKFVPFIGWLGDIDVDIKEANPNNYLECSIGYRSGTKENELDIFDSESIAFINGIYQGDTEEELHSISGWRSKDYDSFIKIQHKYLEDLTQMTQLPHYKLSLDVKSMDSSIFSLGNIYTHDALVKDGSLLEFMCNGLAYNVKQNTYRLELMEYTPDANWRVDPCTCNFSYSPAYLEYDKYGNQKVTNEVTVTTNRPYGVSSSENWVSWTVNPSTKITIEVDANPSASVRDASIYLSVIDCDSSVRIVSIHQDASVLLPDVIQLTPESINLTAGPYATEAVCVVDCSIDGDPTPGWTAAILTGSDFITLDVATGGSGDSIYLTIDQNAGTNPRQGSLDVSCGTAQATFSICQDGTMILCTDL